MVDVMLPMTMVEGVEVPMFESMSLRRWDAALRACWNEAELDGALIAANPEVPSFENTFKAMERRTRQIWKTLSPFNATRLAHNTPEMQALAEDLLPLFETQSTAFLDAALAHRCLAAHGYSARAAAIDQRLMQETLLAFQDSGAFLGKQERERVIAIDYRLTELQLAFDAAHQANSGAVIFLDNQLDGVDPLWIEQARAKAAELGHADRLAVSMISSDMEIVLTQANNRKVREHAWKAYANRGTGSRSGDKPTQAIVAEILALRHENAQLLGHSGWGDYAAHTRMAGTANVAMDMIARTWQQLQPILAADMDRIQSYALDHGQTQPLAPWDLDYWVSRVRKTDFAIDEDAVRQYLPLTLVRAAAFATVEMLFGVSFHAVAAPTYHPDAKPFLVRDENDAALGLLYVDDAIRSSKSSGAWMEQIMPPSRMDGIDLPVVLNVCNLPSPSQGRPALLSMEQAVTVFHELGHAMHSLLTTARYPSQAGVMVYDDFVELQSQLLENWIREPDALAHIAKKWDTGETMSQEMAEQVNRAMRFGKSIAQARYLASAWLDMAAHARPHQAGEDAAQFTRDVLREMGAPSTIAPVHDLTHFTHMFGGCGEYAAGYYSYLWAEVLEADAFESFLDTGGIFNPQQGRKARQTLYSRGNEIEPGELYRQFRGRDPDPSALLRRMAPEAASSPQARVRSHTP